MASKTHGFDKLQILGDTIQLGVPQPLHSILSRRSGSILTRFEFVFASASDLYDNFKVDLRMMLHNRSIHTLKLSASYFLEKNYAETISYFWDNALPKFEKWWLIPGIKLRIFSTQELSLWGAEGGWGNLVDLHLEQVSLLPAFVGRISKLEKLAVSIENEEDVDELAMQFKGVDLEASLGMNLYRSSS